MKAEWEYMDWGAFIDRVLANCDEVGDCLLWKGAMQHSVSPVIRVWPGGPQMPIRRVMWAGIGRQLNAGWHVTAKCGHDRCICPEHATQHRPIASRGKKRNAAARANIAAGRRSWAKLDLVKVEALQASGKPATEIAEEEGMSYGHILRVLRGDHWSTLHRSPFAGLMP